MKLFIRGADDCEFFERDISVGGLDEARILYRGVITMIIYSRVNAVKLIKSVRC